MISKTRFLILIFVLGLSLGLVTVALAAADTARGGFTPEAETALSFEAVGDSAPFALGNMYVNYAHDWVEVETNPNEVVTVTMASGYSVVGTADGDGWFATYNWPWIPENPNIMVGDVITAETIGMQSTVDPVGQVNIEPDFDSDVVSGTIEAPWFSPLSLTVSCEIWEEFGASVQVDEVNPDGGSYFCDFAGEGWDLQPDQMIAVRYHEPDGDSVINIYQPPWMRVNYAHDWVGGDYELGHTFWITLTESDGLTVKATAEVDTWSGGGWNGDGFETWDEHWTPSRPDIQAGDWVFFQADDGYYNEIRVGDISGTLDIDADSISGPINADWFTETLYVECHLWVDGPAPGKDSTAEPDGSAPYFCQWDPDTEWDIQPGQDVAVMYQEPDLDRVINVFREPSPDMRIAKWADGSGQVMPGGPVVFGIFYVNDGDAPAMSINITDTLPANTTYLTDTSGLPATVAGGQVIWTIDSLDPGEYAWFRMVLTNTANPGDWLLNMVDVYVEYDSNPDNNHAEAEVEVVDDVPDLYVDKNPDPGDPAAGQTMLWHINYGNNNPVASEFVVLTDTIPADTTIVGWDSANGYDLWDDSGSTSDQLILTAPGIPGNWGDTIVLRLLLSDTIPVNTQMTNTVEIFTAEEDSGTLGDNWQLRDDVWTGDPRWGVDLNKDFNWGQLVPGGEIVYGVYFHNNGNMESQGWLTDTLPAGTSFVESWLCCTPTGDVPFPPDSIMDGVVYWDIGVMEPGESYNLHIRLTIDSDVEPGTEITNCAEIGIDGQDGWPYDNQECVTEAVNDFGPNLRVTKNNWWNWEGSLNYEVYIENIGTEWLDNVWLTDTYPISTTFNDEWWVNHGPWITATHDSINNQLLFWVDEMSPGETASIGFNVDLEGSIIGEQGLAFANTVEAPISGDVYPADNYDEVTAYTGPDVYVEKWLSNGELRAGEIVTFTVEFGNQNFQPWSGDDQYGSHITETLPTGMSFITATAPWDPNDTWVPDIIDGNTLVWGWGTMWPESTWYFDLVVQITDTVEGGDVLVNQIEAYGDSPDDVEYNWDNNVFVLPLTILGPVFEVDKTYETNMVAGTDVVYTLTVTNTGNEAGTTVVLSDTIPANLTYGDSDGSLSGDDVLWTFASIAPDGGTASGWFSGNLACTAGLTVDNEDYRVVGSDQDVLSENGDPVSFTIISPTITVSFTQSADTVYEGDQVDFTAAAATDGTALTYAWDFGDGGTGTGETPSHTYATAGVYDVTLTVTDGCGYSETVTIENAVTVEVHEFLIYLPLVFR